MFRTYGLIEIIKQASLHPAGALNRTLRFIWERSGNYQQAQEICRKRVLVAFFETTDFCNADCTMCANGQMLRKRQIMPMDIYRLAVQQLAEIKGRSIMLHAFGEPLLDPFLLQRIEFAKRFPVIRTVGFATNGALLDAEKYRELAQAGLNYLHISIDGFHKNTYEKVRVGLSFDNLEKRMNAFLDMHEVLDRPIQLEVSSFTRESHVRLAESRLYRRLNAAGVQPSLKWRVDNWGGRISKVDGGLFLMRSNPSDKAGPCGLLSDARILVLPDGRVTPCHCRDLEGELTIGNVLDHTLLEIWQSERIQFLRREQEQGRFRGICAICSAYITQRSWFTRRVARSILEYHQKVPL